MKRKLIKAYMRLMKDEKVFCYSDGYLFAEENYFESFMTCNLLAGLYDEDNEKIIVELLLYDLDDENKYIMLFESYDILQFDYSDTFTLENVIDPSIKIAITTELTFETRFSRKYLEKKLEVIKNFFDIPCTK